MMRWSDRAREAWEAFRDWFWPGMYPLFVLVVILLLAVVAVVVGGWHA